MAHQCVLSPVRQAVVHRDLLSFCDVSNRYDDQPYLRPTVDFSNAAVGRRMEKYGSSNAAGPVLAQLGDAGKHKTSLATRFPLQLKLQNKLERVHLTRAVWDQVGSRDSQVGGGGHLHLLGTDHPLQ